MAYDLRLHACFPCATGAIFLADGASQLPKSPVRLILNTFARDSCLPA
jgi:hypothetical protein